MSTYTTNYNLEKPDSGDDFKDFRSNYNSNMDIIDANLGGGGGGNVDDVLVNGVSVVDGNHDAQITSYKEVTQAQYDALPATKLTDGIAYFIKDAGGGGGGSSSHNYSTTEQVIGTWIDSKPLYECTVDGLSIPVATGWTSEYATNLNIKYLVNLILYDASNLTNPIIVNVEQIQVLNGGFRLSHYRTITGRNITRAVLQYTKTTDV